MKLFLKQCAVLLTTVSLFSCTKDFKEINTDPNRISAVSPGTLLTPVLYEVASYNMSRADDFTFGIMQVNLPFPSPSGGVHRYDISENAGAGFWNMSYRWLTNVKESYTAAVVLGDVNYQGVALTLNAWMYANLTDAFGDIPMLEATRGDEGILRPKFDSQREVYTSLIASLDSANKLFNTAIPMKFGTEILFANNVTRWKKFANSLRMRLLLRVSKRSEMNAIAELNRMIDNPVLYPVFTSNTEGAVLSLTGIAPYLSPWGRAIDFTTFRAASQFFTDNLNNFNDPRLPRFLTTARPITGTGTLGYKGIPSGYDGNGSAYNFIPSNMNIALVTAPLSIPVLPYAEVEFIKAEVALINNNAVAAKAAYEKGVKASIEQWGAVMPATYFANPAAAYNGTLERIMLQKYYALFFVDYQQWFEKRRTGFPVLPVGPGMLNGQVLPSRYFYPVASRSTNTANYQQAVQNMGGDDINVKVWWQR